MPRNKFVDGLYEENRTGHRYYLFLAKFPGFKENVVVGIRIGTRFKRPFVMRTSDVFRQKGFVPRFRLIAPRIKSKTAAT